MYQAHPTGSSEGAVSPTAQGRFVLPGVPRQTSRVAGPWELPCNPSACRGARTLIRAVLADWHLEHLSDTAELLVSELVGNALLHARGPLRITVERRRTLRCQVADGSADLPRPRSAALDDEHGRGLELVSLMSRAWGVDRTATGKSVWFELA